MSIKLKLIFLFIVIKVIPVFLIVVIAVEGITNLNNYFITNTKSLYTQSENIIKQTAANAIGDSIEFLDKKSQKNLEKLSTILASKVADFLYERDEDLLLLSKLPMSQKTLESFYSSKSKTIILEDHYLYNDKTNIWENQNRNEKEDSKEEANNDDNVREFNIINQRKHHTKKLALYKEITYFDLQGNEKYKVSSINSSKLNISNKKNTYVKAENYFDEVKKLKQGEIYVSDVIGAYVPSNVIGTFNKQNTEKKDVIFNPKVHAYAGKENPLGKKFEGIIRFVTPVYKNKTKVGYVSMALDHEHIMQFTDKFSTSEDKYKHDIADASKGNYAFMWDYEGRNISHARDYFIVGFDEKTGERAPSWVSSKLYEEFKESKKKDLNLFLEDYPTFYKQSLEKKPSLEQIKKGQLGLDCRYLNFAPQCQGWMQLTKDGGYGSFIIYWSKVWKLTTAATIPYYTGKYANSKRGFGFVTIGANVEQFHETANRTKESIDAILEKQTTLMHETMDENTKSIANFIDKMMDELTVFSVLMIILVVIIAIWMSNYLSNKINNLINGTKEFSNNNLDYRIKITSKDEIGKLESSFNKMAENLKKEREELEEKDRLMFQQAKMAALGEMLENIAHQWRQPLSLISSISSSLIVQKELNILEDKELKKSLNAVRNNTEYLSNTIEDFRSFFKPDKDKSCFEVSHTVSKALMILESKFKIEDIDIVSDYKDEVKICGLENELIQVIMNIFNNSKDAFNSNAIRDKKIFVTIYEKNEHMILKIKDTANGIPDAILDRIFEPYFTTKHQSQGTGIGLYMSREIITKHMNGILKVKNKEFEYEGKAYKGAQFTIKIKVEKSNKEEKM